MSVLLYFPCPLQTENDVSLKSFDCPLIAWGFFLGIGYWALGIGNWAWVIGHGDWGLGVRS